MKKGTFVLSSFSDYELNSFGLLSDSIRGLQQRFPGFALICLPDVSINEIGNDLIHDFLFFYKYKNFMNLESYWNTVAVEWEENQHIKETRLETPPHQGQHVMVFS